MRLSVHSMQATRLGRSAAEILHDKIGQVQGDAKRRAREECALLRASLESVDQSVKSARKDPMTWHLEAALTREEALLVGARNNYGSKKAVAFLA